MCVSLKCTNAYDKANLLILKVESADFESPVD